MEKKAAWEDRVNLLLGAWIFVIPWTVNHSVPSYFANGTMWNFWILGALIFTSAAMALQNIKPWEEWTNLAAGMWLILSPWMFGYNTQSGLFWNSVIVGFSVSVLSGLALPVALKRQGYI
jgi:hypothetical protein